MIRAKWIGSFAAVLLCTGLGWGQQSTALPPTYNKGDTITLQEPGKGETKVKVIKATRSADGKMTYEVEDAKTGDKATISDSPMAMPTSPAVAEAPAPQKKGLSRFFSKPSRSSRKKEILPETAPQNLHDAAKQSIETQLITPASETTLRPASGTTPKTKPAPKTGPMSKAPATDWQQSWGKANDHRSYAKDKNQMIQTVSYDAGAPDVAMDHPRMMPQEMEDGVASYPMLGSPYWRVPAPMKKAEAPGIAKVSK